MSQGLTIQLKRIQSLYYDAEETQPVIVHYTDLLGDTDDVEARNVILAEGEPVYIESKSIVVIGDGVLTPISVGDTGTTYKITGHTIEELINSGEYFAKVKDSVFYGDVQFHYQEIAGIDKDIPITDNDYTIANTKFVQDVIANNISNLDGIKSAGSSDPGTGNTLTEFSQTDGKVTYKFAPISITHSQISDAGPSDANPIEDGITAAPGVSANWSRNDHVHPKDSSKADKTATVTSMTYTTGSKSGNNVTAKKLAYSLADGSAAKDVVEISDLKADMKLDKVTNQSKAEMFTDAALTGTPTVPTAGTTTSSTQIASTAFVHSVVETAGKFIYYQASQPSFTGMTAAEQKMPRLWINSNTGVMMVYDGSAWKYVYSIWGSPTN